MKEFSFKNFIILIAIKLVQCVDGKGNKAVYEKDNFQNDDENGSFFPFCSSREYLQVYNYMKFLKCHI